MHTSSVDGGVSVCSLHIGIGVDSCSTGLNIKIYQILKLLQKYV